MDEKVGWEKVCRNGGAFWRCTRKNVKIRRDKTLIYQRFPAFLLPKKRLDFKSRASASSATPADRHLIVYSARNEKSILFRSLPDRYSAVCVPPFAAGCGAGIPRFAYCRLLRSARRCFAICGARISLYPQRYCAGCGAGIPLFPQRYSRGIKKSPRLGALF